MKDYEQLYRRAYDAAAKGGPDADLLRELADEVQSANSSNEDLAVELIQVEQKRSQVNDGAEGAINRFLDEVERPVGTQRFTVPQTDAVNRAIIGLHDAVGRGL